MKKIILVTLLILLLAFTACSRGRNSQGEGISEEDYRTGSKGIELEFMRNSPPDKIYSGDNVDIIIEVRNEGAYPSKENFDGKIEVYGFDEKAFSGEGWDGSNFIRSDLEGKNQYNPQGGKEVKRYHVDRVYTPFNSEFYEPTIVAAACYKYQTLAQPLVCIDPEPYSIFDEEKVCTIPQGGKSYGLSTQGAPVAVTRIEEQINRNSIYFKIFISNVGNGKVVDLNVKRDCPLNLDYNDVDKVVVRPRLPHDATPDCQPRGDYTDPVRLDESGNGVITCNFRKPTSKSAFETVLQVQLDYRYMNWIEKKLQIVNIDR